MENNVTMEMNDAQQQARKLVRCEIRNPMVSWDRTCEFAQLRGLSSEQSSFLFRMLHNILPTSSRLHHLHQRDSPACSLCTSDQEEDCLHALLICSHNSTVNNWIINCTRNVVPNSSPEDIIHLNLDINHPMMFLLIWLLANVLMLVWQLRLSKKSVNLFRIRAEMEAKISSLRKSRLSAMADKVESFLSL